MLTALLLAIQVGGYEPPVVEVSMVCYVVEEMGDERVGITCMHGIALASL
jgi:hypothetical protein